MNTIKNNYLLKQYLLLPLIFVFGAITIIGSGGGGDGDPTPPPPAPTPTPTPPPTPTSFSITGTVTGGVAEDVTITLSGAESNVTTSDNSGNFSFSGLNNGNYTLTPSMTNYTFTPTSINLTINDASSSSNNFTSIGILAGTVWEGIPGYGITMPFVNIALSGTTTDSTLTDISGYYSFEDLPNGSYTITPSKAGYVFNPLNIIVNFSGVATTNLFTATLAWVTYSISGTVTGDIKANVPVNLSGDNTATTYTDINGNYSFSGLAGGLNYTVTPDRDDYTFTPPYHPFTNLAADQTGQNFTGSSNKPDLNRYTVSGNVSYTGAKTGDIYILLEDSTGDYITIHGTSIDAVGAYTIRGVPDASYKAVAYLDSLDNGAPNYADPYGTAPVQVNGGDVSNVAITLTDPTPPAPTAPNIVLAYPYNQGAAVIWEAPLTDKPNDRLEFEIATSYDVYWSTSPAVGPSNHIDSANVPALGDEMGHYFVNNLTNGQPLYFAVRANNAVVSSGVTPTLNPITIGATTGGSTVSGSVSFSGPTGHALYLVLYDFESAVPMFYTTRIAAAASPESYSLSGVANGNYHLAAVLDVNDSNFIDTGDLEFDSEWRFDSIIVDSADVTYDVVLNSDNALTRVSTEHSFDFVPPATFTDNGYSVFPELSLGVKRAVKVTLTDGQGLNTPIDIGAREVLGDFESQFYAIAKPYVNDPYTLDVTYADGTTETIVTEVKAVLESYPTPTYPVGTFDAHPTFTWDSPASPPSVYYYNLAVYSDYPGYTAPWSYWDFLPSTTPSLEYNVDSEASLDPLVSGYQYWWHLYVIDPDENRIMVRTHFQ